MSALGSTVWIIAEGYIPPGSTGDGRQYESHETICVLNAGDETAEIELVVYYSDREPVGPYRLQVPPRRTRHFRFNDLEDPEPIPRGTDYASVLRSTCPVVVQHTRLDSRQEALALMSTIAFPAQKGMSP